MSSYSFHARSATLRVAQRRANWFLKLCRGVPEPAGTRLWRRHLFVRVHSLACRNRAAHEFQISYPGQAMILSMNRMIIFAWASVSLSN